MILSQVALADTRGAAHQHGAAAVVRFDQDEQVIDEPEEPRGPGGLDDAVSPADDAPADLKAGTGEMLAQMPPQMRKKLAELGLL